MKFRATQLLFLCSLALALCSVSAVFAANLVTIYPAGKGTFVVQGTGLADVAGIDITITYDAAKLSAPKVTQGSLISSAMMAPNTSVAGTVRLAIISAQPMAGSGPIATIAFEVKPGATVGIRDINIKNPSFIDAKAKPLAGGSSVSETPITDTAGDSSGGGSPITTATTGGDSAAGSSGGGVQTPSQQTVGISGSPAHLGTVSLPPEGVAVTPDTVKEEPVSPPAAPDQPKEQIALPDQAAGAAPGKEPPPRQAEEKVGVSGQKPVLERFKEFNGEKTTQGLIALFTEEGGGGFTQEPPIALADGKSTIRITVNIAAPGEKAPNLALKGAQLKSLHRGDKGSLIIEAIPSKGSHEASLNVLTDSGVVEYPLTVAPPVEVDLNKSGKVTEEDFRLFLKGTPPPAKEHAPATKSAPVATVAPQPVRLDLNGDGKHDYLDDYIFTANYLAMTKGRNLKK